jgi:hypothetical protein
MFRQLVKQNISRNIEKFKSATLDTTFKYYDDAFDNLVTDILTRQNRTVKFNQAKTDYPAYSSLHYLKDDIYYFNFPFAFYRRLVEISRKKTISLAGFTCSSIIDCFLLIFEHEFVHFIQLISGADMNHDHVFRCMTRALDHSYYDHFLGFFTTGRLALFRNWQNSCYLDSLLVCLLLGANNKYRDIFLRIKYEHTDKKICVGNETLTSDQIKKLTIDIQSAISYDYSQIFSSTESLMCRNLRGLLSTCLPSMRGKSGYSQHADYVIYGMLVDFFPSLLVNIPTWLYTENRQFKFSGRRQVAFFKCSEFFEQHPIATVVDPIDDVPLSIEIPRWNKITSDIIVFCNDLIPYFKKLNDGSDEMAEIWRHVGGKPKKITQKLSKRDVFGEYIINKKYRLFAMTILDGPAPKSLTEWGGGHYTAYVRPVIDLDSWYFYNDIGVNWRKLDKLPASTFVDRGYSRPSLLFYEKSEFSI